MRARDHTAGALGGYRPRSLLWRWGSRRRSDGATPWTPPPDPPPPRRPPPPPPPPFFFLPPAPHLIAHVTCVEQINGRLGLGIRERRADLVSALGTHGTKLLSILDRPLFPRRVDCVAHNVELEHVCVEDEEEGVEDIFRRVPRHEELRLLVQPHPARRARPRCESCRELLAQLADAARVGGVSGGERRREGACSLLCVHMPRRVCAHMPRRVCAHMPRRVCAHVQRCVCVLRAKALSCCTHSPTRATAEISSLHW